MQADDNRIRDTRYWGTRDELEWLRERADSKRLLEKYRQGATVRDDWGTIDKDAIMAYLEMELG